MDDAEQLARKAAEAIMQRVNDTRPRTLHLDVLVDEIAKVVREAKRRPEPVEWPPPISPELWYAPHDRARNVLPDLP